MTRSPVSFQFIVRVRTACMVAVVIVATMMLIPSSSSGIVVAADASSSSAAMRRPVAAFLKRTKSYTPLLLFKVPKGTMDECE